MSYDPAKDSMASYYAALAAKKARGDTNGFRLYCFECDRYEADPIFLDVETCSKCGALIGAAE